MKTKNNEQERELMLYVLKAMGIEAGEKPKQKWEYSRDVKSLLADHEQNARIDCDICGCSQGVFGLAKRDGRGVFLCEYCDGMLFPEEGIGDFVQRQMLAMPFSLCLDGEMRRTITLQSNIQNLKGGGKNGAKEN